jgi:hypothetical protein
MAESLRFSVGPIGGHEPPGKIRPRPKNISIVEALAAIKSLPVTQEQKEELSRIAKRSPEGSLNHLVANYHRYLKST